MFSHTPLSRWRLVSGFFFLFEANQRHQTLTGEILNGNQNYKACHGGSSIKLLCILVKPFFGAFKLGANGRLNVSHGIRRYVVFIYSHYQRER